MSKIAEEVENFITPIANELGYEIVEVEFAKKYNGDNLTIYIDKKGGIDIDDCEKFHNAINEPLDELNPTADKPYILNVSSPGIDRPIKTDKDFERNLGEIVEIRLFKMLDRKKLFVGKLIHFSDTEVVIEIENKEVSIERNNISKATKYIEF